ncbi:alpha/beta hydrolase [Vibrio sp. 10N.261.51.F12]|uniref:COG3904 family protein n=1 Tax=Vibrio sp. 10N.261.51.F12 TaxID=3229679 RepID=UPI003553FE4A
MKKILLVAVLSSVVTACAADKHFEYEGVEYVYKDKTLFISDDDNDALVQCSLMMTDSDCNKVFQSYQTNRHNNVVSVCSESLEGDRPLTFSARGDVAQLNGVICDGSLGAFEQFIKYNQQINTLDFVDLPGSIDDETNLKLAYLIRKLGLNTSIGSNGHIASGGTDLFLSGVKRRIEVGAKIGVHSWADGEGVSGGELSKTDREHTPYITYYKEMGLPDPAGFYFFTLEAAPPNGMHYLTKSELDAFGFESD